jgi:hypothetical protein
VTVYTETGRYADDLPRVHVTAASVDGATVACRDTTIGHKDAAVAADWVRVHARQVRRQCRLPDDAPVTVRLPAGRVGDVIGAQLADDHDLVVDPYDRGPV